MHLLFHVQSASFQPLRCASNFAPTLHVLLSMGDIPMCCQMKHGQVKYITVTTQHIHETKALYILCC